MDATDFNHKIVPLHKQMFAMAMCMLRNRDDAADAVQDAMKKLWERHSDLELVENLNAFCMRAARNAALDRLGQRRDVTDIDTAAMIASDLSTDTAACSDSAARMLDRLINMLPAAQARVLRLSVFRQLHNDEIAGITGLTAENVRQLLSRGRRSLKDLYLKYKTI